MVERIILRKVKNQEELILDMVSTPDYILESVDWGTIQATHHSYKYVNQVGETIDNTSLETRPIEIKGWIVAKSESHMTMLKRKLNSFVNPKEAITIFYNSYKINFVPNETVRYSIEAAENNEVFCKFQIYGIAPNPLFSDEFETSSAFVTTIPSFHFPLVLSNSLPDKGVIFGKRTASLIVNVYNKGSDSVGMKIIFKANGTVINPSLTNVNTQEEFTIDKTLIAEEEIVINTSIGEKGIKGKIGNNDYTNYFMYKNLDSSWLQLNIGDNLFRYNAEDGIENLDVFVYFYNQYVEVQECR